MPYIGEQKTVIQISERITVYFQLHAVNKLQQYFLKTHQESHLLNSNKNIPYSMTLILDLICF